MTARTRHPRGGAASAAASRGGPAAGAAARRGLPVGLAAPLAVAGVAGLLRATAPLLPVLRPDYAPGFGSFPLLLALAMLPVAAAAALAWRGNGAAAAGLLGAVAWFVPGQLLLDLHLVLDPGTSTRPDLALPNSLLAADPAAGSWVLLGGHLLTVLAGGLAVRWYRLHGDGDAWRDIDQRIPGLGEPADVQRRPDRKDAALSGPGRVALALPVGLLAGIGLLLSEPFESTNAFLLARSTLEQHGVAFLGGLLLVVAAPVAAGWAAAANEPAARRGGLLGVALALGTVAVPPLVSGLVVPSLSATWGPVLVLGVALLLGGAAGLFGRTGGGVGGGGPDGRASVRPDGPDGAGPDSALRAHVEVPGPPAPDRLLAVAGSLGVLGGAATVLAGIGAQVVLPGGLPQPPSYADRLLDPAGIVVGLSGVVLLVGALARLRGRSGGPLDRLADTARPAYLTVLVLVPLASAQALDGVLAAGEIDGVRTTAGPWLCLLGTLLVVAGGGCALAAGTIERDDVDLTEQRPNRAQLAVSVLAALLAVGAFTSPTFSGSGFAAPSLSAELTIGWWGLAATLLVLLGGCALAPFSRPVRATALLCGAALVVAVHLLELPLTSARVRDSEPGAGTWLGGACLVALLAAAAVAARRTRAHRAGTTGRDSR